MTVPIRQNIVDALVAVLDAMDTAGGYNLEWASNGGAQKVVNVNRLVELPTCIVADESEDKVSEFSPFQLARLEFLIQAVIEWPKDDQDFEIYRAIDLAAADVERAVLKSNEGATPYLGIPGLEKIEVGGHVKAASLDDGDAGAVIRVFATYRHNSFDPGVYP